MLLVLHFLMMSIKLDEKVLAELIETLVLKRRMAKILPETENQKLC